MDRPEVKNRKEEQQGCEVPHGSMEKGERKKGIVGIFGTCILCVTVVKLRASSSLRNAFTPKHVRVQPSLQAQPRLAFLELDMRDFHH